MTYCIGDKLQDLENRTARPHAVRPVPSQLLVEAFEKRGPTTDAGKEQQAALKAALAGSLTKVRSRLLSSLLLASVSLRSHLL